MNIDRLDQNFLKTLTVLYVEDDADTRKPFSEFLRRPVGALITATNGVDGLEAFKKHLPDIVVTDILMPQMDGLTMAYEIRAIVPSVPIIVITAFEQTNYLLRAIDIGVDIYVTKPVNSELLLKALLKTAHILRAEEQLNLKQQWKIQETEMDSQKLLDQLRIIFELSPAGIVLGDPRGFITFANRRMAEMLGYPEDELIGTDYLEYVHRDEFAAGMEKQQQLMAGTIHSIDDERRFVRKDGTVFKGHIAASLFEAESASQNGLVCLITDVR
ncbi:MAG: response regulator [Desulfuromonadaceae bacterium]